MFSTFVSQLFRSLHNSLVFQAGRPRQRKSHGNRWNLPAAVTCLEDRKLLSGVSHPATVSGVWTQLTNANPQGTTGTMMLLSDGTVMAQTGGVSSSWSKLTPDTSGNYLNGTWSGLASMSTERLYVGSNVLPDGRVFVLGGEYSGFLGSQNFNNTGEIYDPVADSWSNITDFPQSQFGDDPTVVLANGKILAGYLSGPETYLYDPATDSWSQTGTKLRNDASDEETWVLLPDGSVLSYDVLTSPATGPGSAQRYIPSTGQWVDAGVVPVPLSGVQYGFELGPATLLPDGRVFLVGANNNTVFYNPTTNTWTAGPTLPAGMGADDAPGAMLPNGHFIFAADTSQPNFTGPTLLFDLDPSTNTLTDVTPAAMQGSLFGGAYTDRMLVLPNGHLLFTSGDGIVWDFLPQGTNQAAWAPTISSISKVSASSSVYTLTGTKLTGISEGASYGDDAEMSSNYPIIRLTDTNGVVTYARSMNWTPSVSLSTNNALMSVQFTLPSNLPNGRYQLAVIANGIASSSVSFVLGNPPVLSGSSSVISTGSTPVVIDPAITVTSSGSQTLAGATVAITNFVSGQDLLAFANNSQTMGNIAGTFDAVTGILTLTSSNATATLAQFQSALRSVTYANSSTAPNKAPRTIAFQVNDGSGPSNVLTSLVYISAVPPVLSGTSSPTYFVTANPVVINGSIAVTNPYNATLTTATVKLTNFYQRDDVLSFANIPGTMANITGVFSTTTGILTLTSVNRLATATQWQTALRAVTYSNRSGQNANTAPRYAAFQLFNGALGSNLVTVKITLAGKDSAPVVSGSATAIIANPQQAATVINPSLVVTDSDNTTLASATVKLTNYYAADDVLGFTSNAVTMGNITGGFNTTTGVLTLSSLGSTATVAQFQAALRSVTYSNRSAKPNTASRTALFQVSDGTLTSVGATSTIAFNDQVVLASPTATTSYNFGQPPTPVNAALTVTNVFGSTLTRATVRITNPVVSQDLLGFLNDGVTMGNITGSYSSGTSTLTLVSAGGTATLAQFQAALRAVTYYNSSSSPNTTGRAITFQAWNGSLASNLLTTTIAITNTNRPPVLSIPGSLTYIAGQGAVAIDLSVKVTDPDNTSTNTVLLTTALIRITNYNSLQDTLAFSSTKSTGDITGFFDATTGLLTLTSFSGATLGQFQNALRAVTYTNSGSPPNKTPRIITFQVSDGIVSSNILSNKISFF